MDSNKDWYYLDGNNQVTGPLTRDALSQLVAAGVISDQTLVAVAGNNDWVEFRNVSFATSSIGSETMTSDTVVTGASTAGPDLTSGGIQPRAKSGPKQWKLWLAIGGGVVMAAILLVFFNMPITKRSIPGMWRTVVYPTTEIVFDAKGCYQEVGESQNGRVFDKPATWGKWVITEGRLVLTPACGLGREWSVFELAPRSFFLSKKNGNFNPLCALARREGKDASNTSFARTKGEAKTWKSMLDTMIKDNFDAKSGEAMVTESLEENDDGFRVLLTDKARQRLEVVVKLNTDKNSGSSGPERVSVWLPVRDISVVFQSFSNGQLWVGLEPTAWEKRLEVLLDTLAKWTPVAVKRRETLVQPIKNPGERVPGDTAPWGVYFFYANPASDTYWIFQNAFELGQVDGLLRLDERPVGKTPRGRYGVMSLAQALDDELPPTKPFSVAESDEWAEKAASDPERFIKVVKFDEYVFGAHEIHLWRHLLAGLPRYRELAREMLAKKLGDLGAVERDRLVRENEAKASEAEIRASEERARKDKQKELEEAFPQPGS